jgi:alcohol dehydrogenase class IV
VAENANDTVAASRLERFSEVARIVTGIPDATAGQGALWLECLVKDLKVPGLEELVLGEKNSGFTIDQTKEIIEGTCVASSTKGNPVVLSIGELEDILKRAS